MAFTAVNATYLLKAIQNVIPILNEIYILYHAQSPLRRAFVIINNDRWAGTPDVLRPFVVVLSLIWQVFC
jgi:hypothetical protein